MMFGDLIQMPAKIVRSAGLFLQCIAERFLRNSDSSKLVQKGTERSLYRTPLNDLFWLNDTGYVDKCIKESGVFEPESTDVVNRLVKKGDVVLDVGANIGYYTVILSRLVGPQGKVLSFEPTEHFGQVLKRNIETNQIDNVELYNFGLSDVEQEQEIQIGVSSATLHSPGNKQLLFSERIMLKTLDEFLEKNPLPRVNLIKIDVDGHEPFFLNGASKSIDKYDPVILLEVNHLNYLEAGHTAWDFYDFLRKNNYHIYDEHKLQELTNRTDFLIKCGNFAYSSNIIITKSSL